MSFSAPYDISELRGRAAADLRHPLTLALLTLTVVTGIVDAVSYLGLGHVFAANMTGNVVLLGFGIAGTGGLPVLSPIISLAAFLAGAAAGGALAARLGERHLAHVGRALVVETGLTLAAVVVAVAVDVRAGSVAGDAIIALLAFAMGIRNATVRRIAVPDLTTTVLTLTLTGLAADSRPAGGTGSGTHRRVAATVAMLAGAVAGALLVTTGLVAPLAVAGALTMATWLGYPAAMRRTG